MTLWHTFGREIAGAWRSVRYDLRSRRDTYAGNEWSYLTGLSAEETCRRVVTASGVVLLIAGGAAGTYLAVAGGLGALLADPAGDGATPQAAPAPPAASAGTARDRELDPLADAPKTHRLLRRTAPSTVPAPETERPPALPGPSTPAGIPIPESTPLPEPSTSSSASPEPVPSVSTSRIWGGESGARG